MSPRTVSREANASVVVVILGGVGMLSGREESQAAKPPRLSITNPGMEIGCQSQISLRRAS